MITWLTGDVFEGLATLEDNSVDLVVTSPPFLALRSYLPADHPDKGKEIGSEATPAAFLDVMLAVTAELGRVLAPHGSIAVELGDTYAGSGGGGGDYLDGGWREGQQQFAGAGASMRESNAAHWRAKNQNPDAWPLAKSKTLIPELYRVALAYGFNPLTGEESHAGRWRVRNVVTWCRPNPPVGALGDKWRPATSDIVVACRSGKRFWDDLATRRPHKSDPAAYSGNGYSKGFPMGIPGNESMPGNPSGAPLLDYWEIPLLDGEEPKPYGPTEKPAESPYNKVLADGTRYSRGMLGRMGTDGEGNPSAAGDNPYGAPLLDYWEIPPAGYAGAHYAVYPPALVEPLVKAMCPERVCRTCGEPSRRIIENGTEYQAFRDRQNAAYAAGDNSKLGVRKASGSPGAWDNLTHNINGADKQTIGFTDCGHGNWRPGIVLDPFAGSGTTLAVASGHGHDSIGIDLDPRNEDLARERVGPLMWEVVDGV